MEHLPPISNPYKPVFIPFVADHNISSFDFSDFSNPKGLDVEQLLDGNIQNFPPKQIASFLQTWLYFGMMREVLDIAINMEDFVRTDPQGKWITTEKLPQYMQIFRAQVEAERPLSDMASRFDARNSRIQKCFATARTYWLALVEMEDNPLPEEAYFGIHVLANTLQVGATEICGRGGGRVYLEGTAAQPGYRDVPWEKDVHWRLTPNAFMERRMQELGWCPVVSEQIRAGFNLLGQYYVSLFQPPVRRLNHEGCSKSDRDCMGYREFAGSGKHLVVDCECDTVEVDNVRLEEILQNDEVPVLCFDEETKALEIVSSKSQPELEYVAISHVWSDGWGNPQKNSLTLCRIEQLVTWMKASYSIPDFKTQKEVGSFQRLSDFQMQSSLGRWQRASSYSLPSSNGSWTPVPGRGFVGKMYFWMDTLCVPRSPKEIHNRAVMAMRNVYADAERVLVLDAELLASPAKASYEEINMRIQASRWIRRLWTVQEAALAKRLIFQFKEASVLISAGSRLWEDREIDNQINYYNSIGWDCYSPFSFLHNFQNLTERIKFIWMILLDSRSVTVASDEAICGSILMDFDLKYLLAPSKNREPGEDEDHDVVITQSEADERMSRFWEMHASDVPIPILFVPGAKLPIEGFSWAPASLIPCSKAGPGMDLVGSISKSRIPNTREGRTLRWVLGSILRIPLAPPIGLTMLLPPRKAFLLSPPPASDQSVKNYIVCSLDGNKYYIKPGFDTSDLSDVSAALSQATLLAVIVELLPQKLEGESSGQVEAYEFQATRAALLVVRRRGWFTWTAQYLKLVSVVRHGSTHFKYPRVPYSETDREEMRKAALQASWRTKEEKWCLV
ncbi:hypothetical protein ACMFMG_006246 [Clarireedia jacksonii]